MDDYIPQYPSADDPDIQLKIARKLEFRQLAGQSQEQVKPGEFLRHQLLCARLMLFLDVMLLFHETGTGKSGVISAIASFKATLLI